MNVRYWSFYSTSLFNPASILGYIRGQRCAKLQRVFWHMGKEVAFLKMEWDLNPEPRLSEEDNLFTPPRPVAHLDVPTAQQTIVRIRYRITAIPRVLGRSLKIKHSSLLWVHLPLLLLDQLSWRKIMKKMIWQMWILARKIEWREFIWKTHKLFFDNKQRGTHTRK